MMKFTTGRTLLALAACAALATTPLRAGADDIDIFTGASAGSAIKPRILIVLDNTSNWSRQSQQWPGGKAQGQSEADAIEAVVNALPEDVNLGLMEFVTGGNANDDGGFVRWAVKPLTAGNKALFSTRLTQISGNINSPDEKRNSHTPYGNLMYDVYNYFAGAAGYSPGGVIGSLADSDGYTTNYSRFKSPLSADNTCGKSYLVFIGNPNASGPAADSGANTSALANLGGVTTQLRLPNFTSSSDSTSTLVDVTSSCYANAGAAAAEIPSFSSACGAYSEGCTIGAATANTHPVSCAAGTQAYSVIRSVVTPASSSTAPGTPVVGTPVTTSGVTTNSYASASAVDPNADHGSLTCPAGTTTTSDGNTATTTYSCSYAVGAASGSADPDITSALTSTCYKGVGTSTNYWNANATSDYAGLTCPADHTCTYSGTESSTTCTGNRVKINVKQTATPTARKYVVTQTATPTTTNTGVVNTPASTATTNLGFTSACYASAPSSVTDYAAECSGTNVSCAISSSSTAQQVNSCPAGTSAYQVVGTDTIITNVETTGSSTDSNPLNADEWVRFMHDKGIPVTGTDLRSQVKTYTIDVHNKQPNATHTSLLLSMARVGGGKYFIAKNEQSIVNALKEIVGEILATNSTFASTSLPVNATNRSQNENEVYIGMFRPDPTATPRWFGNLKRYILKASGETIELADVNGKVAVNNQTGFVTECATSYWTTDSGDYWSGLGLNPDPASACPTLATGASAYSDAPDGPQVEKGAVAEVIRKGNNAATTNASPTWAVNRNVYTASSSSLVAFNTTNTGLDSDTVKFVLGEDVNNERGINELTSTRPSIHGDVIHSRPLPVNYGQGAGIPIKGVTVFYGANDGTLRAIDAANGNERWAFVAPEFNARLGRLKSNSPLVAYPGFDTTVIPTPTRKDYFFDGGTGLYQNRDSSVVWIYPSMRRGGRMVYGLDVSNAGTPSMKWKMGCPNLDNDTGCSSGMAQIGQTWSTPSVAFVKGYEEGAKPVVVFGGGYDSSCEDVDTRAPACVSNENGSSANKGGVIYILDAADGSLIRSFNTARSVVGDVAFSDVDSDGKPDYAYAADTGGNIYRIDFISNPSTRAVLDDEDWVMHKVAYTTGGYRKFLFAPALLTLKNRVYVAIGSGDREHPLYTQYPVANVANRFYVYLDDLTSTDETEAYNLDTLLDYTSNTACTDVSVLPASASDTAEQADARPKGWFMTLRAGEQVVTTALIAGGMVTFSTNQPQSPTGATCKAALGKAYGYWVNLFNASGAIGVDGTCGGTRDSEFVGGGLPPSPVLASSVRIGDKNVSVVIGAVQKEGGSSVSIAPQKIRPSQKPIRKRSYSYTSGQ